MITDSVARTVSVLTKYYSEFFNRSKLTPIHELASFNVDVQTEYAKPFVLALLLQVLKESESNEDWSDRIYSAYSLYRTYGLSEYDAVDRLVGTFQIKKKDGGALYVDFADEEQDEIPEIIISN